MKVLIIYNMVPEEDVRAVVDMSEAEYEFFSVAHNVCVNSGIDTPETESVVNVIGNAFCTNPKYINLCETTKDREYFGKWKNSQDLTDIRDVEKLIVCSFLL